MSGTAGTPYALGAYLGYGATAYQAAYGGFLSTMGTSPQYDDVFMDATKPVASWASVATQTAALTASYAMGMTPVIDLSMASSAPGSLTSDQQYQAFASGQYDSVLKGIVDAWAQQGFSNLVFRLGSEMNIPGANFAGSTAQDQADWVAAFRHMYTVMHAEATADGVNLQIVWNPDTEVTSSVNALTNLYPGNNYVDVIGGDVYSDMYPRTDTWPTLSYHDWATGGEDTSLAQWMANPVNREHYWNDPGATAKASNPSTDGSLTLPQLLQFAEAQGKPFAIPETGAGNSNNGTDVNDDAAFPQWVAAQLNAAVAAGEKIDFVNIWDSNDDGNYQFSDASDDKPQEAAAWAQYFGASPTAAAVAVYMVPGSGNTMTGGQTMLNVDDQYGYNVITGGAGGLNALVAGGGYDHVTATASASVSLTSAGNTVTGGSGLLTVTDTRTTATNNTITGGSGGMVATINAQYDTITTLSGASDTITLGLGGNIVHSNGDDLITANAGAQTITATGNATIVGGTGSNTYTLSGKDSLTSAGSDKVSVTGGSSVIQASGASITVTETGGTVQLTETGGGDSDAVTVSGGATISGGAGHGGLAIGTGTGAATITLGGGSNTVTGSGADTIYGGAGSLMLQDSGATVTLIGGAGVVTLANAHSILSASGGQQGATQQIVLSATGDQVTFSSVTGGAAQVTPNSTGETITGGAGLLTVSDTKGSNSITGGAGGLNASISGAGYDHVTATASASVSLTSAGNTVTGGAGLLTVSDTRTTTTNNTIAGGAGGMTATINAQYDTITTQAGASDSITLGLGGNTVHSNGNDLITIGAVGDTVVTTGNATIMGGAGYNYYTLSGVDRLTSTGSDHVTITGGSASIAASGASITVSQTGGSVSLTQSGGGQNAAVTVSGAASITGGSGRGFTITTGTQGPAAVTLGAGSNTVTSQNADTISGGAGIATVTEGSLGATFIAGSGSAKVTEGAGIGRVQFGSGSTSVVGGSGQDLYSFLKGSGGGVDTISNFRVGVDQLSFVNFTGSAVSSQTVVGGSLTIGLTDHTQIILTGVTKPLTFS